MIVPEPAAWIGVPYGTPMSIPSCIRPQRIPKGLVTGPETGQIRPAADGVPDPYEPEPADERCAAVICAPSFALSAASAFASSRYAASFVFTDASVLRSWTRAD